MYILGRANVQMFLITYISFKKSITILNYLQLRRNCPEAKKNMTTPNLLLAFTVALLYGVSSVSAGKFFWMWLKSNKGLVLLYLKVETACLGFIFS